MGHLNELAAKIWQNGSNKGFHGEDGNTVSPVAELISNLHGEVSELWEAYRKGALDKQCDKPVTMTCAEEELADIIIRALDTAYALKVDIDWAIHQKHFYNTTRPFRHGGKLA